MLARPDKNEYADYFQTYVSKVPEGDIIEQCASQRDAFADLLGGIGSEREEFRYAEGKWSIKEVVGHVLDAERVFAYRTLVFARNDRTPLPSFDADNYVAAAGFDNQTLAQITDAFVANRTAYVALLRSFTDDAWLRRGTASGFEFTVRAIAYIVVGHAMHHAMVLRERYL